MSQSAHKPESDLRQLASQFVEPHGDLYREVFSHSKEAIAIINPDGSYLEQNGAHYTLLGYSDQELEGKTPAIHLGQETFLQIARQLAETGEYSGEVVSRTKSGEERNIELSAFTMRNGLGEPVCYVGIKRDITKRKEAEKALRRNESDLTDFFETSPIGLHWVGPDGTILRVNQAELDLLGYTREEYVGRNIAEFHVDPEAIEDILQRLLAGEVLQEYEARLRCRDGSIKQVHISSSVYREEGEFIHTRCFTFDITDRRRAEQRLALQYAVTRILSKSIDFVDGTHDILETVCEGLGWQVGVLWAVDHHAEVLRCIDFWQASSMEAKGFEEVCRNRTFKRGIGIPGRIWSSGKPVWISNVMKDNNFPRASAADHAGLRGAFGFPILLGEEVVGVIEFFSREIRRPDQELLEMIGSVGQQIGQFRERKRAEEKLAQLLISERTALADSEKANRLKDEFLATLSHELRTPLNAVIGWSRMLKSGRLDKESALHALGVIERNAWAQKQIIEDILDVSRVITGKLQLRLAPVDIAGVVNAALDAVRPALEAKDILIQTQLEDGLRFIPGDADRLQQVVWNLLSNASKFTPNGGTVEVRVSQVGAHLQIQVSDTGPGINPEFLPHVFERFRQEDGSTTRTHGGLGLGLAIVRHLVELHGGLIEARNREPETGAVFTVKLPLPSGELRPEFLRTAPLITDIGPDRADLKDIRILVVEDETDALDLITMELAEHGASVKGVATADQALALLKQMPFDLLISDIGMPDTDGYELIKRVRNEEEQVRRNIPAVALTGYAQVQDRIHAIMAGYNTHIAKPVETHELVTVVRCLTGRAGKS
jgi:PAS domain S-box-containing protein